MGHFLQLAFPQALSTSQRGLGLSFLRHPMMESTLGVFPMHPVRVFPLNQVLLKLNVLHTEHVGGGLGFLLYGALVDPESLTA